MKMAVLSDSPLNSASALFVIEYDSEEIMLNELDSENGLSSIKKESEFNIKDNIFGDSKQADPLFISNADLCDDADEGSKSPPENTVEEMEFSSFQNWKKARKNDSKISKAEPFLCSMCDYQTKLKTNMKKHMNRHLGIKPYKCTFCDYRSTDQSTVKSHEIYKHTGDKHLKCDLCDFRSHIPFQVKLHMKKHISPDKRERPFSCTECDAAFEKISYLNLHIRTHTNEKNYECDLCDYKGRYSSNLLRHKRTRHKERTINVCPVCDKKFITEETFKEHVQGHSDIKPFVCKNKNCGFKTTSAGYLRNHVAVAHSKKYSCEICDFKCGYKSHLKAHHRKHTGEKPFSCPDCNYTARQAGALSDHMRIHNDSRPFPCDQCEYAGRTKTKLKMHCLTVHSSEKPYSCEFCDSKFKLKGSLRNHLMLVHFKEKT